MPFNDKSFWCSAICQAEVKVRTGICDHEKNGPQTLYIEAKMYLPVTAIVSPQKIEEVTDYDRVYKTIKALENQPHVDLLEQIAIKLADTCFQDTKVGAVEITIDKPDIYEGSAIPTITLAVTRDEWSQHFSQN